MKSFFKNEFGKIRYAAWEWTVMRVAFCVVLWHATFHSFSLWPTDLPDVVDQEKANGLPGLVDFEWIGASPAEWIAQYFFLALLIVYAIGKWQLLASGGLLILHAVIGGIFSSPAKDHHATQIVGMVLLGQFLWFAWEFFRQKTRRENGAIHDRPSGAIFFSQQLIAAAYTVSALCKWVNSGGGWFPGARWIAQVPNIPVQFEKNNQQAYFDALQLPSNAELNQFSIDFVIHNPGLAMAIFGAAFYLEFFAVLALWNRKIGLIYGLALIGLHVGIAAVMHLPFYYFEAMCLLFFVNVPFWVMSGVRRVRGGENSG